MKLSFCCHRLRKMDITKEDRYSILKCIYAPTYVHTSYYGSLMIGWNYRNLSQEMIHMLGFKQQSLEQCVRKGIPNQKGQQQQSNNKRHNLSQSKTLSGPKFLREAGQKVGQKSQCLWVLKETMTLILAIIHDYWQCRYNPEEIKFQLTTRKP